MMRSSTGRLRHFRCLKTGFFGLKIPPKSYFRVPSSAAPMIITAASAMLPVSGLPLTPISNAVEANGVR